MIALLRALLAWSPVDVRLEPVVPHRPVAAPPPADEQPRVCRAGTWTGHCPTAKPWTRDDPHGVAP